MKRTRRSIRLNGYDYSRPGAYFVTICTRNRMCVFGNVVGGRMVLNDCGRVVETVWEALPEHYPHIELDVFVLMPNHVHGVIWMVGAGFKPAPTSGKGHGLPEIVRGFKTFSSRRINDIRRTPGVPVWQRNYFERIVRNDNELNRIREYIAANPTQWAFDRENPNAADAIVAPVGAGLNPSPTAKPWEINP